MATPTKFVDTMRGVNSKLAALRATTAELTLGERQALLEALSKDVQAAASAVRAKEALSGCERCRYVEKPARLQILQGGG